MSRTQKKILVTKAEASAYTQQAARFGVPVAVWAVQVLRQFAYLESMRPPRSDHDWVLIPQGAPLSEQFKIRLTPEESDATIDAARGPWSDWVRTHLRQHAKVRD